VVLCFLLKQISPNTEKNMEYSKNKHITNKLFIDKTRQNIPAGPMEFKFQSFI